MRAEFIKKSKTKRRKIFLDRTSKLMSALISDVLPKMDMNFSEQKRDELIDELVKSIYQKTLLKKDEIITDAEVKALSRDELVSYLEMRTS